MSQGLRCVMIVGDGFSRSFINHVGLQNRIVTHTLFPAPVEVPWNPDPDFPPEDQPDCKSLSDKNLFPFLWEAWETYQQATVGKVQSVQEWAFYDSLWRNQRANTTYDKGSVSLISDDPPLQLRAYLFYLFRHYFEIMKPYTTRLQQWEKWEWFPWLQLLNQFFDTTYISFNYDLVLESALGALGFSFFCPVSTADINIPTPPKARRVVKPHGSIAFHLGGFKMRIVGRSHNVFQNCGFSNMMRVMIPPPKHTSIFEIVPPGHNVIDRIIPEFRLEDEVINHISNADLIILCGLSAREPDTKEIRGYLSHIKRKTSALHLGLPGDDKNDAGQILRKFAGKNYKFMDVLSNDFHQFPHTVVGLLRKVGKV